MKGSHCDEETKDGGQTISLKFYFAPYPLEMFFFDFIEEPGV